MDMDMTIHFGEREVILFKFWKTGSLGGIAISMLITFLLCLLFEAIKGFRLYLAIYHANCMVLMYILQQRREQALSRMQSPSNSSPDAVSIESVSFAPLLQITGLTRRLFTKYRIAQGILYGVQALLAYVLMLIVMTFNGNLILAVVVGESVGYFLFTGTPLHEGTSSGHC